eukprot:scaffold19259_cov54-Attheya_sp.AAC.1
MSFLLDDSFGRMAMHVSMTCRHCSRTSCNTRASQGGSGGGGSSFLLLPITVRLFRPSPPDPGPYSGSNSMAMVRQALAPPKNGHQSVAGQIISLLWSVFAIVMGCCRSKC